MHNGKNMLIKAIILSFTFIVGVFVMTAAWFTSRQTATASGINVSSKRTEGLQVSFDNKKWDYNISENFSKSLPLITGDGTNFIKPALHINEGKPLNGSQGSKAESGTDYIDKTIYLRSQVPMIVSVTDIKVTPQVANEKLKDFPASKSAYGDFSKDYIAAAARVAIVKETKTETKATNFIALCIPLSYGFQPFSFNNDIFLRNSDHPQTPSNLFCYFHLPVIVHHSCCISSSLFSTY